MIKAPHFRIYKIFIVDASRPLVRFGKRRKGFSESHGERSRSQTAVPQIEFVLRFAQEPMGGRFRKLSV